MGGDRWGEIPISSPCLVRQGGTGKRASLAGGTRSRPVEIPGDCSYNMHVSQSEGESTDRDRGAAERGRAPFDWAEADVSGVSEGDFPISCNECEYRLTGLGDTGRCPECGTEFARRRRLWELHGPEAFARPPIADGESEPGPGDRRFVVAVFTAVVCAAAIPIGVLIWQEVSGTVDRWLCLAAWLVMATCVEWIMLNRVGSGQKEEEEG